MKYIIIIFLLLSTNIFGQTLKIGQVRFKALSKDNKPKETIFGTTEVYENNVLCKGKKIAIYIEVLPAKTKERKEAPMFILMGGPGQAATDLVSFFADIFKPINQNSDIVFIDQRGTGKSNPLKLLSTYTNLQDYLRDEFIIDSIVRKNYTDLAKKNDLSKYGTLNALLDIETIRKRMSYDKINIYGTSYGTRLGLAYINRFGGRVRTATFKGLVPESLVVPYYFAEDAERSLDLLINDCADNDSCNKVYPALRKEIQNFMSKDFPIKTEILNPQNNTKEPVEISKGVIAMTLRVLLMSPSSAVNIPYLITEAHKGNYLPLANIVIFIKKSYITGLYDGMSLCVTCFEDYPILNNLAVKSDKNTFLSDYWTSRIKNSCNIWNPSKKLSFLPKQVYHTIPVLLISSNRDAATPPKYGNEVLKYFTNGRHIIIDQASHSFNGLTGCVENIICEFVKKGNSKLLGTRCIQLIKYPPYKLR